MKMFEKNKIEISKILDSEEVFKKIVLAIKNLMMSDVHISKLGVGGEYYKNYYDIMEDVINDDKNQIFYAKNITFSSFGQYIKQNMCNYGIYFHLKKDFYLKKINKILLKNLFLQIKFMFLFAFLM